jgi:hypothetical protein
VRKLRTYISILLFAVISVLLGPKELVHELLSHHHHDTEDAACADYCKEHIDEQHRHCDVLELTTPPLYLPVNNFSYSFEKLACILSVESTSSYHSHLSPYLFFRGPPAC